ncbi:MAG TPA: hypothetical protein VMZ53_01465 [Kofleriaceae bacterium]|nr:hypothetical protein [Kofleriaceae bacterium]
MKKLTLAMMVAMAFVSFGCKKKAGSDSANAMAKMQEFADEMCKCKDAKCAQDVSDKMTKWGQEQSKNQKEPPKMNEADTAKAQEIGKKMGECMTKAMGAGGAMGGGTPEAGSATPTEGSAAPAAGSGDMGSAAAAGSAGSAAAGSAAP